MRRTCDVLLWTAMLAVAGVAAIAGAQERTVEEIKREISGD